MIASATTSRLFAGSRKTFVPHLVLAVIVPELAEGFLQQIDDVQTLVGHEE